MTELVMKHKIADKLYPSKVIKIILLILFTFCFIPTITIHANTNHTILLEDFSGTEQIYHEGFGNSNQTIITDTNWALDTITVTGSSGARTVLEQFISAGSHQTNISRNALFIGSGKIDSDSIYKGSNSGIGQDNRTGIMVLGENYGVLIQPRQESLFFNENFGGITKSIATASGNYEIQQSGEFGTFASPGSFIVGDISTLLRITGVDSATVESSYYGSFPLPEKDAFQANTNGWAHGDTTYFFSGIAEPSSITSEIRIVGQGEIDINALFETLEANSHFRIDHY